MSLESEDATPITDEELAAAAVDSVPGPRVSSPPPVPPEARRASRPPPPLPGRARATAWAPAQSGTWRIVERASSVPPPSAAMPPPPPAGRTTAVPPLLPNAPSSSVELAGADAQIARLRLQLRQREDRILELERQLAEQQGIARDERQARSALEQRLEQLTRQLEDARARAVAPPDDLKRIAGIGPGFERALHQLGVTSFSQIAAWSVDDIHAMASQLKTRPGRILRDRWVEHARELAQR